MINIEHFVESVIIKKNHNKMSKFSNFFKKILGIKNENIVCEKCTPTVEVEIPTVEVEKPKPILVKKPVIKKVEQKEEVIIELKTEQPKPKSKKRNNKNKKQPPKL